MSQLMKRLVISGVFIIVTIAAIFFLPHWFFFLVIEIFILLGLNEFFSLAEQKGLIIHRGFGLFFGAVLPFPPMFLCNRPFS